MPRTETKFLQAYGFSLIELMVTLSIFAILAGIAMPSFSSMMAKYRLSNENTALMLDLVFARGEAVNRSTRITACQSSNGTSCTGGGWGTGRIVFVDSGAIGTVDAGDLILRVSDPITNGDTMTPAAPANISYDSTGTPNGNLTIVTCKSGYTGAKVIVYPTGRIRADTNGVCP